LRFPELLRSSGGSCCSDQGRNAERRRSGDLRRAVF
jgi:hypothetical protein